MSIYTPDLYVSKITKVTPELLQRHHLRGLILDIDNTLTHHNSQQVGQDVLDWIQQMRAQGIALTIVSNNNRPRVTPFAAKLGMDFVANGCKPLPFGMKKAVARLQLPKEQIAVIGDQIYTDIVGGNAAGLFTILVEPFEQENGWFFALKRRLEAHHLRHYHRLKEELE